MNDKMLNGIVELFVNATPHLTNAQRRIQFGELLEVVEPPKQVAVSPNATQWPADLTKTTPVVEVPKVSLAQAMGLKPESTDPIRNRVYRVIAEQLGYPEAGLTDSSHIVADLGADSLDTVELVMAIEDEFNLEVDDEVAERCHTVGSVVTAVKKALNPKGQVTLPARHGGAIIVKNSSLENGRVYVNIRKHPAGFKQPTGKRKVVKMQVKGGFLQVGIGNGAQGWTIDLSKQAPSFLDFIVNGENGQKVSIQEAIAYWKRHNP